MVPHLLTSPWAAVATYKQRPKLSSAEIFIEPAYSFIIFNQDGRMIIALATDGPCATIANCKIGKASDVGDKTQHWLPKFEVNY